MVKKKKASEVIWKWKYSTTHRQGEKYILEKKEKANLVISNEKNQKTRNWLVKRKKHHSGC